MILAIALFEDNFLNIVAISFTSLILVELLNVALEINKWHILMVVSEIVSILMYIASMFLLRSYFDVTFIFTSAFAWKVAVITSVSCLPPAMFTFAYRKYSPPAHSKVSQQ